MSEIFLNKARSCAVSGHRVLEKDFDKEKIERIFYKLVEGGFNNFFVGMALGFDTVCFQILENIRKEKDIKIIACVPCKTQSYKYNREQKKEYDRMLSVADEVVLINEEYSKNCMQKRNQYMVDRSCALVAYLRRDFGGTANTVKYARKKGVAIIET